MRSTRRAVPSGVARASSDRRAARGSAAPGGTPDPDELIAFCHDHLAVYKCPKSVDFAEVLPRNPSGKLLKRELRAPYWEGSGRQVG